MFGFFKKKRKKTDPVLRLMDGREVKYVTQRDYDENGRPKETILGKTGRILCLDGEIQIMCGEKDVFSCPPGRSVLLCIVVG